MTRNLAAAIIRWNGLRVNAHEARIVRDYPEMKDTADAYLAAVDLAAHEVEVIHGVTVAECVDLLLEGVTA